MTKIFLLLTLSFSAIVSWAGNSTIANLPANSWYQVSNSHLNSVAPSGWSANVMAAWSGGAYDTKRERLIIWGGGHNDYNGNEVYVFDVPTLTWKLLTQPTANPTRCSDANADGTPNSRHTYSGLAYISHADRFFASGGALNCGGGGCGAGLTWTFDFGALHWTNRMPSGTKPQTGCGNNCSYDSVSKKVFWGDGTGLFSYDYTANSWTKHNSNSFYYFTSLNDPKRGLIVVVGGGNLFSYDYKNNNYTRQNWTTTGGSAFISSSNPGFDYDPVSDRYVGWSGGAVYVLNPDTKVWSSNNPSGGPTSTSGTGTYGRWRYAPSVNAFVNVNAINQNVYFYKLTGGTGVEEKKTTDKEISRISISPNPVTGRAVIEVGAFRGMPVRIFDAGGRRIAEWTGGGRITWDASRLPTGVYTVKAGTQETGLTRRIIVAR